MRRVLGLLQDESIERRVRVQTCEAVKHLFLVRPRLLFSPEGSQPRVSLQDEKISDFQLDEWIQINQEFKSLVQNL